MKRLMRFDKIIGGMASTARSIYYKPKDTSRAATNVQAELDKINDDISEIDEQLNKGKTYVDADGVKTYATMLAELYALIDWDKVSTRTAFMLNREVYLMKSYDPDAKWAAFTQSFAVGANINISVVYVSAGTKQLLYGPYNHVDDISTTKPQVNARFSIVY